MTLQITHTDCHCKARTGILSTGHGSFATPAFMPVGTVGTVKTLSPLELRECGVEIMLSNTYHLYLRPGTEILRQFGGLHRFNGWDGPILTDSGGYQVYSLNDLIEINEEGVEFKSHLDGSRHLFTPERVVEIQRDIGSDIMMVLDYLTGNPSEYPKAESAHQHTLAWAERSREHFLSTAPRYEYQQIQFGIIQGGTYLPLREQSISGLVSTGFEGYAIGGLAVGESAETRHTITDFCTDRIPEAAPRYLMGVGKPVDILDGIELGVDMFDCVIPTRNARNGSVFTSRGPINLRNAGHREVKTPIDSNCPCLACRRFSIGYLHHLIRVNEILGLRLATLHNIQFYQSLMKQARAAIAGDQFMAFKQQFEDEYANGASEPES